MSQHSIQIENPNVGTMKENSMEKRHSVYLSWKHLTNKYASLLQQLKADTGINAEERLRLELVIERQISSGLEEITRNLSYANHRKPEVKNV